MEQVSGWKHRWTSKVSQARLNDSHTGGICDVCGRTNGVVKVQYVKSDARIESESVSSVSCVIRGQVRALVRRRLGNHLPPIPLRKSSDAV